MTRRMKEKSGRSTGTSVRDEAFAGHKPGLTEAVEQQQQHTGNHGKKGADDGGADRFGGTRAGAENVE